MNSTDKEGFTLKIADQHSNELWKWAYIATHPVRFKRVNEKAVIPEMQKDGDACYDLFAAESWVIQPGEWRAIDTGLQMEIPPYLEARIRPRSGLALKEGLTVLNAPGTIDSGYRGNVKVILINHSGETRVIKIRDRIAQLSFHGRCHVRFEVVEKLNDSERGEGGFGSTGQ